MRRKLILVLAPLALIALFSGWMGLRYWWNRGYSRGTRTGTIRKLSVKGSPMCRYFSGEMVLVGSNVTQPEIWEFSVDDYHDDNPVVQQLRAAERKAGPVTVRYRQDRGNKGKIWSCAPTEYYIVAVE